MFQDQPKAWSQRKSPDMDTEIPEGGVRRGHGLSYWTEGRGQTPTQTTPGSQVEQLGADFDPNSAKS